MTSLHERFVHLDATGLDAGRRTLLSATPFPDGTDRHVAKSLEGRPIILVCVRRTAGEALPVSYVLENLRIAHDWQCRIKESNGAEREDRFTVVECNSDDLALQSLFLRSMEALLAEIPDTASLTELAQSLDHLVELFQAIQRPPQRSVIGLWGELWLISTCADRRATLRAWHESTMETSDFSQGLQRLEVKCSSDRTRRHYFSLEQAHAPEGATLVIASLFVEQVASGVSLGELWDELRDTACGDASLVLKIDRLCIQALGSSWEEARHKCFDAQRAAQSLIAFDSREIPRIAYPVPPGISDVHFRADLATSAPLTMSELDAAGGLYRHVFASRP
jgi:hypothetical protein